MSKLTLSIDQRVVSQAKRYARARGTSLSSLVEQLLHVAATGSTDRAAAPPVLSRLRGSLSHADRADYRRYLERKHR